MQPYAPTSNEATMQIRFDDAPKTDAVSITTVLGARREAPSDRFTHQEADNAAA